MTERPMALCTKCGTPLISTVLFSKAEFYCLDCGAKLGFLDPKPSAIPIPTDIIALEVEYNEEWQEHVGDKLLGNFWLRSCEKCKSHNEYHIVHATDTERAADTEARAWLAGRIKT